MNPIFFCSDVATIVRIIGHVTKAWIVQSGIKGLDIHT
jgi:hypothetical protein